MNLYHFKPVWCSINPDSLSISQAKFRLWVYTTLDWFDVQLILTHQVSQAKLDYELNHFRPVWYSISFDSPGKSHAKFRL